MDENPRARHRCLVVEKLFRSVLSGLPRAIHSPDLASLSQLILFGGLNVGPHIHGLVKIPIIRQNAVVGELPQDMLDEFRAFDVAEADQVGDVFRYFHTRCSTGKSSETRRIIDIFAAEANRGRPPRPAQVGLLGDGHHADSALAPVSQQVQGATADAHLPRTLLGRTNVVHYRSTLGRPFPCNLSCCRRQNVTSGCCFF
jgi:hypothetical protein